MTLTVRPDSPQDLSPYVSLDGKTYIAHPSPTIFNDESPRSQTNPRKAFYDLNVRVLDLRRVWQEGGGNGGLGLDLVIRTKPINALLLSHNQLDPATIPQISQSLVMSRSLRLLDLDCCKITHSQLKTLVEALLTNPPLESLSIRGIVYPLHLEESPDDLTPEKIVATLVPLLTTNTHLEHLALPDNNLGPAEGLDISTALKTNSSLRHLDLSCNKFGSEGGLNLTQALVTNSTLNTLNLRFCEQKPENASAFRTLFAANTTLTSLDLSDNQLGEQGGLDLAATLNISTSLFLLNLANCEITSTGCEAVASSLVGNSTLISLNLSHNPVDDSAVSSIATALKSNGTLTEFSLDGNTLTAEQGARIAAALTQNTSLSSLQLGDRCLQHEITCRALHLSLSVNSTLTSISLSPLHYYPTPTPDRPLYPRPAIRSAVDDRLERNAHNLAMKHTSLFERTQRKICEMEWATLSTEEKNRVDLRYRLLSNNPLAPPIGKYNFFQDLPLFWQAVTDVGLENHFELHPWSRATPH